MEDDQALVGDQAHLQRTNSRVDENVIGGVYHYPLDSPVPGMAEAWSALWTSDEFMRSTTNTQAEMAASRAKVDAYIADVLHLPRGPQWTDSVVMTLQEGEGRWFAEMAPYPGNGGSDDFLPPACLVKNVSAYVAREARREHRLLVPIWSHRSGGRRMASLDMLIGNDGLQLYDVVHTGLDPQDAVAGQLPDDPRVAAVLAALEPRERAIALVWASWKVDGWQEAAQLAGADDPVAAGERVRRKLKRLGARQSERVASTGAALPPVNETGW